MAILAARIHSLVRILHVLMQLLFVETEEDVRKLVSYFVEEPQRLPLAAAFAQSMPMAQLLPSTSPVRTDEHYEIQSAELGQGLRRLSLELPSSAGETVSPSVAGSDHPSTEPEGKSHQLQRKCGQELYRAVDGHAIV